MNINELKAFLGEDWQKVNDNMKDALQSDIDLLNMTNDSIMSHSGKQIRPLMALLVAKACCHEAALPEDSFKLAAAAELLHNATLLHDDVADDSNQRRGAPTIKALMGPSVSVLVGDYWLVSAMKQILSSSTEGTRIIGIFARTLGDLAEGEMLQLQKAQQGDTTEEDYLRIIYNKTASLFEATALSAALSVGVPEKTEQAVKLYSSSLGIAFQIKDDIFDYAENPHVGKPVGVDVREQKITMPLLGAFLNSSEEEEKEIRKKISDIVDHPEYGDEILSFVRNRGGIAYAERRLKDFVSRSVQAISVLPESKSRRYLEEIAAYVAERNL